MRLSTSLALIASRHRGPGWMALRVRFYAQQKKPAKKSYPRVIFSGIQPTGAVHIGNYLGTIRNWVHLQNDDSQQPVIWSIADLHSITLSHDQLQLKKTIPLLLATLLACGIDPERSIIFQQSTVPMHTQLAWILSCITTMQRLTHQPQYKEKSENLKDVPLGLYIYPVLQAADILLYKATHVPVGQDQLQHLQLAEHLAQKFNTFFGETFPMPTAIVNETAGRIQSLRNPLEKMSKSAGSEKARIELTDEPDVILKKVKKAVTDFTSEVTYEPDTRPGVSNLIAIHSLVSGKTPQQICDGARGLDTGKYKLRLAELIIETLNPIRTRINEFLREPQYLEYILQDGKKRAEEIAITNWLEVSSKVGFNNKLSDIAGDFKSSKLRS